VLPEARFVMGWPEDLRASLFGQSLTTSLEKIQILPWEAIKAQAYGTLRFNWKAPGSP